MASSYVNDLRLNEMATGDASGTWGDTTNTNLELIAEAFSYGTEVITTNADTHTTTIADGATDPGRSMYLKYTGTLDSACTITIGPNTVSKVWIVENGTSGSQNIILSQGSGANITIPAGDTKVVYSDGAGSGAAFFDAFASLNVVDLKVQDDLTVTDDVIIGGDIDLEGSIDVNGTANLDIVDIDGAVNMATTALVTGVLTTTATQVATGGITSGSDIISDTDSTDSLGSTGVRWLKGWFDSLTAGTLTVGSGSVTDSSGAISFGDENLTTTGIVTAAGTSVFTNLDISGDVDVDGTLETDNLTVGGAQGTDGQVLTSTGSGVAWEDAAGGADGTFQDVQVFTSSGTWSKPANLKRIRVYVTGGGGAGKSSAGGGGAGGGTAIKVIEAAALGSTETVTVGAGATDNTSGPAGTGGTSSFGSHCSATGGGGGAATAGGGYYPGDGGTGSGGDLNLVGQGASVSYESQGGCSYYGGGGRGSRNDGTYAHGSAGGAFGGGGGGAISGGNAGDGAAGVVYVEEYFDN
jgi:hypothetical protein